MVNARYPGTARLFHGRLPPEITDIIARYNHANRVIQTAQRNRRLRRARIRTNIRAWAARARATVRARRMRRYGTNGPFNRAR